MSFWSGGFRNEVLWVEFRKWKIERNLWNFGNWVLRGKIVILRIGGWFEFE